MAGKKKNNYDVDGIEQYPLLDIRTDQLVTRVGLHMIRRYFTEDDKRWHEDIFYPSEYGVSILEQSLQSHHHDDNITSIDDILSLYQKFKDGELTIIGRVCNGTIVKKCSKSTLVSENSMKVFEDSDESDEIEEE